MSEPSMYRPGDNEGPPGIACGMLIYAPDATILIQSGNYCDGDLTQAAPRSPECHQSIGAALCQQGLAIIGGLAKVLKIFFF